MFRRAILAAAAEVFVDKGFHAARIQDIAARAKIGVGTVYNHFEQKEDVLVALLDEHTTALAACFAPQPSDPDDFAAALVARVERFLSYEDEHRAFVALAMDHGLIGPSRSAADHALRGRRARGVERLRREFMECTSLGVERGALSASLSPVEHARTLGGVLRALTYDALVGGKARAVDRAREVVDVYLHGAGRKRVKGA